MNDLDRQFFEDGSREAADRVSECVSVRAFAELADTLLNNSSCCSTVGRALRPAQDGRRGSVTRRTDEGPEQRWFE